MYAKKLKRKCTIRGCKCVDTYSVSLTREAGNTVIICRKCLEEALEAVKNYNPDVKPAVTVSAPPSLFFSGVKEEIADTADSAEFICPKCGKVCKSTVGLNSHIKACTGGADDET